MDTITSIYINKLKLKQTIAEMTYQLSFASGAANHIEDNILPKPPPVTLAALDEPTSRKGNRPPRLRELNCDKVPGIRCLLRHGGIGRIPFGIPTALPA